MKTGRLFAYATAAALTAMIALPQAKAAATVFVDDDFNSYTTQGELEAVWSPDGGDGQTPSATVGILIPSADLVAFPEPNNDPPGLDGKALGGVTGGGVNEWNGGSFDIIPSATQNVVLKGDLFNDGSTGNWRHTIGLRNDTIDREPGTFGNQYGMNLFEMGLYNADTCDPTVEGCVPGDVQDPEDPAYRESTQFGFRTALFGFGTLGKYYENGVEIGDLQLSPNYQYFALDPALDLEENGGNGDGVSDSTDVGEGWHAYTATISETGILIELDLYRDGVNNVTNAAGPDATVEFEIGLNPVPGDPETPAGFTSLRVGGPSGISGNSPVVYDNLYLALEDIDNSEPLLGDYNGDLVVDAADYTVYRDTLGSTVDLRADGNGNLAIDPGDYTVWSNNYGEVAAASAAAVPEPSSLLLIALPLAAAGATRRRS